MGEDGDGCAAADQGLEQVQRRFFEKRSQPMVLMQSGGVGIRKMFCFYGAEAGPLGGEMAVTVCTVRVSPSATEREAVGLGQFVRGVAIRSVDDEWDQHRAMFVAWCYASRALKGRLDKDITDPRAIRVLAGTACPWRKHSDRAPELTWFEAKRLLGAAEFKRVADESWRLGASFTLGVKRGGRLTLDAAVAMAMADVARRNAVRGGWPVFCGGEVGGAVGGKP
jgi:hypothetical protein